jgi:hypothetical protein
MCAGYGLGSFDGKGYMVIRVVLHPTTATYIHPQISVNNENRRRGSTGG